MAIVLLVLLRQVRDGHLLSWLRPSRRVMPIIYPARFAIIYPAR
jgi:hypothetical protein